MTCSLTQLVSQGHLLIVHPPILDLTSSFFHPSQAPPTTPASQSLAFQRSTLPQLLESLPPLSGSPDAGDKNARAVSCAPSADERVAAMDAGWSPVASGSGQPPATGSLTFVPREVLGLPSYAAPLLAPHSGLLGHLAPIQHYAHGGLDMQSSGLETLASVAVPDDGATYFASAEAEGHDKPWDWMEGVLSEQPLGLEGCVAAISRTDFVTDLRT